MSRPGAPDLFESCSMLQPRRRLASPSVSPNTEAIVGKAHQGFRGDLEDDTYC
jgi:hypothetical protein